MEAAVIAIGDEITSGQRVDTNSAWLSQRLCELGIPVTVHVTAADELEACANVFRFAATQADVIVATGGLGPTADDLTREAIAMASERPLLLDELALEAIRQLFESRGRTMPERNQLQAMFPEGSTVIPNPHGTAPGIDLHVEMARNSFKSTKAIGESDTDGSMSRRVRFVALPGVPAEMREMWHQSVVPTLATGDAAGRTILHRRIKCFGVGESACESMIPELISRGREPRVGITVHRATITLRITASGNSSDDCNSAMQPIIQTIHEQLGDLVFGEEDDELQHAVVRHLATNQATLSCVETDTLGLLAHWLSSADEDEQSQAFLGGLINRSSASDTAADDFPGGALKTAAEAMAAARMVREQFRTTYGLAVGRFPNGDLGEFQIAIACEDSSCDRVVARGFAGHPDLRIERSVKQAMDVVRRQLKGE